MKRLKTFFEKLLNRKNEQIVDLGFIAIKPKEVVSVKLDLVPTPQGKQLFRIDVLTKSGAHLRVAYFEDRKDVERVMETLIYGGKSEYWIINIPAFRYFLEALHKQGKLLLPTEFDYLWVKANNEAINEKFKKLKES